MTKNTKKIFLALVVLPTALLILLLVFSNGYNIAKSKNNEVNSQTISQTTNKKTFKEREKEIDDEYTGKMEELRKKAEKSMKEMDFWKARLEEKTTELEKKTTETTSFINRIEEIKRIRNDGANYEK